MAKLGMMRYSTPWCAPVLQFGETCRPSGVQLTNITLNYPGGLEIHVKDAHQVALLMIFGYCLK